MHFHYAIAALALTASRVAATPIPAPATSVAVAFPAGGAASGPVDWVLVPVARGGNATTVVTARELNTERIKRDDDAIAYAPAYAYQYTYNNKYAYST
jgi:hypothetical protein